MMGKNNLPVLVPTSVMSFNTSVGGWVGGYLAWNDPDITPEYMPL
jgi:hypothetical protein